MLLAICLGCALCAQTSAIEATAPLDVLGRVCLWLDPAKVADFDDVFDARFRPLLRSSGVYPRDEGGRSTRPGVFSRLIRADRASDLVSLQQAIRRDSDWTGLLKELASSYGPSQETDRLRYEITPYRVSPAKGRTVQAGPGTVTWPVRGIGHWRTYDVTDGLLDDDVLAIYQDRDGYLWFGTWSGGVSRYDGGTWVTLTQADGLASNWVWSVCQDRDGNMWFGTRAGVTRYNGERMETFLPCEDVDSNGIWSMVQDNAGDLWFGTHDGLHRYDGTTWTRYTTADGLAGNRVRAALCDEDGQLWFGTDGGASRYDGRSFQSYTTEEGLLSNSVRAIARGSGGSLLFGTVRGISRYDGAGWSHVTREDGLVSNGVNALLAENHGCLWVGTGSGVSHHDGRSWHTLTLEEGLANNHIRTIYRDREGYLWSGTEGGVSQYDRHEFVSFTGNEGLARGSVEWIYQDRDDGIWFGTGGGLSRLQGDSLVTFTGEDGLPGGVSGIVGDQSGTLWLATSRGAAAYDGARFVHFGSEHGLATDQVYVVYPDRDGAMWFGTSGGGISRYDGETLETFTEADGLASNTVRTIIQDTDGDMWFGCFVKGISRYDGQTFHTYTTDDGLASNWGRYIHQVRTGRIWVAAGGGGVNLMDGERFIPFTTANGFINNWGRAIQEGADGHMWFGTGGGVARYDGRDFQKITRRDGLASNQVRSMRMDREGNLWVGTINGVTRFRPPRSCPPSVFVRSVIADRRYPEPEAVSVASDVGMVAIEFGAVCFKTLPDQMVYRYRLHGRDADWESTSVPRVEYEDLAPGDYRFEVLAIDRDLVASVEATAVSLHVHYPYERLGLLGALIAAIAVVAWQTARVLRRDRMLGTANEQLRHEIADREQAEADRERLSTQLREMRYLYRLRSGLGAARTPEDIVGVAGRSIVDAMSATSSGASVAIEHDGRRWEFGEQSLWEPSNYVRPLAWGDRDRGRLELSSSVELSESQEHVLLDETAGQLSRVLEARELELQLLQSARLVSLGQMSAGVAHELNQPLSAISMTAGDIISRMVEGIDLSPDELKQMMEDVSRLVTHMSGTVNHLRIFSRDTSEEAVEAFSMNDVVNEGVRLIQVQLREHSIDLLLTLADGLPRVVGSPNQMEQVVLNLLSNARDALDERQGGEAKLIEVRTTTEDGTVVLTVSDNGVGMEEADRQRVFEPFFTTKNPDRGTGLGLSISYAIVRNHNGQITCTSVEGKGSNFRLALPVGPVHAANVT